MMPLTLLEGPQTDRPEGNAHQVEEQLNRLLQTQHFRNSQRIPSFLRYVVKVALDNKADALKERIIGIEVFGRPTDYDTSTDPIVRVTAAEVRKRIAQYYAEPGHEEELRISIPVGTYCPSFEMPRQRKTVHVESESIPSGAEKSKNPQVELPKSTLPRAESAVPLIWRRKSWFAATSAVLTTTILIVAFHWHAATPANALNDFWAPMLSQHQRVLLCIADKPASQADYRLPATRLPSVAVLDDLEPLLDIASQIRISGGTYSLRGANSVSLRELREGPNVFIGAFDNQWSLRLLTNLRYSFAHDGEDTVMIQDRQSKSPSIWRLTTAQASNSTYKDYAIAARFRDDTTGQMVVIMGGLYRGGTIAAGEFLTNKDLTKQISSRLPADWQTKNVEVVLSTQIIDGRPTQPHLEAAYSW